MTKTILVTGGAGFIGSHLCAKLLLEGNKIVCIDNLSTGRKENIDPLIKNNNFRFEKLDVRKIETKEALSKISFDEVYHLASPASVTYITEHPVEASTSNSIGTLHLLELALQKGAKFLFTSSSEAYGDPKVHPQKETYWGNVNPVGIRSGYDEGKRFGEALCMAYYRELKVSVKIVRIFNTYGPNSSQEDSRVVPVFIVNALQGKPLPVHGDGMQTRSFCYVKDLVDGITKMMESSEVGPINLGNSQEYKIIDLAKEIISITRSSSAIQFTQRPADDPSVRKPDITLAKERLKWEPRIELLEGLTKTIDYFKKILP